MSFEFVDRSETGIGNRAPSAQRRPPTTLNVERLNIERERERERFIVLAK